MGRNEIVKQEYQADKETIAHSMIIDFTVASQCGCRLRQILWFIQGFGLASEYD